jgi:hypothetical protein
MPEGVTPYDQEQEDNDICCLIPEKNGTYTLFCKDGSMNATLVELQLLHVMIKDVLTRQLAKEANL